MLTMRMHLHRPLESARSMGAASRRVYRPIGALVLPFLLAAMLRPATALAQEPSILDPASPNASALADLFRIVFYLGVAVFFLVEGLIVYAVLHFRRRDGDPMPTQTHGNARLEIAWTIVPAIIVVVLTVLTYRTLSSAASWPCSSGWSWPSRAVSSCRRRPTTKCSRCTARR